MGCDLFPAEKLTVTYLDPITEVASEICLSEGLRPREIERRGEIRLEDD